MSDRELLEEIHQMLKKVCRYIDKVESPEYIEREQRIQFDLNVAADMYVDTLNNLRNENKKS